MAVPSLTGTKLVILSAETLDLGIVDYELSFSLFRAKAIFNEYSHLSDLIVRNPIRPDIYSRTSESENGVSFRITAGLSENFEMGISYGQATGRKAFTDGQFAQFQDVIVGAKYRLWNGDAVHLAVQGGIFIETEAWTPEYNGGGILTLNFTENLSMDLEFSGFITGQRWANEQSSIQRGGGLSIGTGNKIGQWMPVVEAHWEDSYRFNFRQIRAGKFAQQSTGFQDNDLSLNFYSLAGLPDGQIVRAAGFGEYFYKYPQPQEKVKIVQQQLRVLIGINHAISDGASASIAFGRDIYGINILAGKILSGYFTFEY